jgi:hypothetical protein
MGTAIHSANSNKYIIFIQLMDGPRASPTSSESVVSCKSGASLALWPVAESESGPPLTSKSTTKKHESLLQLESHP